MLSGISGRDAVGSPPYTGACKTGPTHTKQSVGFYGPVLYKPSRLETVGVWIFQKPPPPAQLLIFTFLVEPTRGSSTEGKKVYGDWGSARALVRRCGAALR